jgi:hypothetical protein
MTISQEVTKYVDEFKTKHSMGFIKSEVEMVIEHFKSKYKFNMDKYYDAMYGNTCMVVEDQIVNYHCDVIMGVVCGIEDRELTVEEWD